MTIEDLLARAPLLSVGILTADLLQLGVELEAVKTGGLGVVHVDVMDGVFCPSITVGAPIVKAIPDDFVKDVHLLIDDPLSKVDAFVDAGADVLTFHVESTRHPHRVLQSLAGSGVIRGVALNPGTPLEAVTPLLDELELLLLLAVNPGWGGQAFIPTTEHRIVEARELVGDRPIALGVDGGITSANIAAVVSLGVDVIVAGSAVYDGGSAAANAQSLAAAIAGARRP